MTYAPETIYLDERSKHLRNLVIKSLKGASRGHIGPTFSLIEILRVLYDDFINHRPEDPNWADRDRLILSKGHGCLALYALLADKGYFPESELGSFCSHKSILGGHPEYGHVPGVEASTGALGHGFSIGIGMALAARIKQKETKIYVVLGDGELNEGSVWEAAMCSAMHNLANLIVVIDKNQLQCYGKTIDVLNMEPLKEKWEAFGFRTIEVNGHDVGEIRDAVKIATSYQTKPCVVICNTTKGKGFKEAEGNPTWHYKHHISPDDIIKIKTSVNKYS